MTNKVVTYIFSNLKIKLSSEVENIPNITLKNIPEPLVLEYCKLFNNMLNILTSVKLGKQSYQKKKKNE